MKKVVLVMTGLLLTLTMITSCTTEESIVVNDAGYTAPSLITFANRGDLLTAINEQGDSNKPILQTRSATVAANTIGFSSLVDPIIAGDPILSSMSEEEKKTVLSEGLSYYDLLGYETFVPNRGFAKLLNKQGEVVVGDTIIRVTPLGTLCAPQMYRNEIDSVYAALKQSTITFSSKEKSHMLSNHVSLLNTFNYNSASIVDDAVFDAKPALQTRTAVDKIPSEGFPFFSYRSHTVVGKILGSVLGQRSVKEHYFKKDYRVCGSLYDYDYGVYYEIGSFVSLEKKRGGFFKFINGWKEVSADELSLYYKGIVLELNFSANDVPNLPKENLYLGNHIANFTGLSRDVEFAEIFGYKIKESDVIKAAGSGLKEGLKYLASKIGGRSDSFGTARAARIVTPSKTYIVIWDQQLNSYNQKELRKVFASGTKFYVTLDLLNLPASLLKYSMQTLKDLNKVGVSRLVSGEVHLAVKSSGVWGGMRIQKN